MTIEALSMMRFTCSWNKNVARMKNNCDVHKLTQMLHVQKTPPNVPG